MAFRSLIRVQLCQHQRGILLRGKEFGSQKVFIMFTNYWCLLISSINVKIRPFVWSVGSWAEWERQRQRLEPCPIEPVQRASFTCPPPAASVFGSRSAILLWLARHGIEIWIVVVLLCYTFVIKLWIFMQSDAGEALGTVSWNCHTHKPTSNSYCIVNS